MTTTPESVVAFPERISLAPTMSPKYVSAVADPIFMLRALSQEVFTSSLVIGEPSENCAELRINLYFLPFSSVVHDLARAPIISLVSS